MHPIDYSIVGLYLVGLFVIGILLARKAGRGDDDYFLGGRNMPWWALGASGMSSNLDVAGTTTIIALIYHFGLHGFFIEFRGGVVLPIAVWLAFMGKWHRRSGVTTTAEWMRLRFGAGPGGRAARFTAALTYLVITVGMVFFFLSAAGSFLAEFWPGTPAISEIRAVRGEVASLADEAGLTVSKDGLSATRDITAAVSPEQADAARRTVERQAELRPMVEERESHERWLAVGMAVIALAYTAAAGLYGVVWTDVFQCVFIAAAAIYVGVVAYGLVTPELLASWPGSAFNTPYPQLYNAGLDKSGIEGLGDYSYFGLFLVYFLGKGLLEGLGGSGGSAYMAQRFYAARDDAATRKIAMLWAVLFAFRWPMVLGLAIIAVKLGTGDEATEVLLPRVLQSEYFPVGLRGLMVAALFAASMSTFDSTINAGASYVVKDLYVPLSPYASPRRQVVAGYVASAGIVALGLALTLLFPTGVLAIWQGIVLLFAAFLVPFALRWFWPRFTGAGFTLGVAAGFVALLCVLLWPNEISEVGVFAIGLGSSLAGCLLGTFLTPRVDDSTLMSFYRSMRPLGAWRAYRRKGDADRREHRYDLIRLVVALLWQVFTFLLPMLVVLKMWPSVIGVGVPWAVLTVVLLRDARGTAGDEAAAARA